MRVIRSGSPKRAMHCNFDSVSALDFGPQSLAYLLLDAEWDK